MNLFEKIILTELPSKAALQVVKALNTEGVIQQRGDYCYLKIDDNYIHHLQPILTEYGNIAKPAYFAPLEDIGAHISIIYPEEGIVQNDVGQKHTFSICGLIKAKYGMQEYFALIVNSPSLAAFRQTHHLAAKPTFKGQEIMFHITVGVMSCES